MTAEPQNPAADFLFLTNVFLGRPSLTKNEYTNQTTTKVIYVGTDDVLKAFVATGGTKSILEIEQLIAEGAKVDVDGTLILNTGVAVPHVTEPTEDIIVTALLCMNTVLLMKTR